jgi:hypothetical protein
MIFNTVLQMTTEKLEKSLKPLIRWDVHQVLHWLDEKGLGSLRQHFSEHEIDGEVICSGFGSQHLRQMKITNPITVSKVLFEIRTLLCRYGEGLIENPSYYASGFVYFVFV